MQTGPGSVFTNLVRGERKGQNGTAVVIGGSEMYTGAPLFSAKAALRSGSDLVYVFSAPQPLAALRSLHEAIVVPLAFDERVLGKATACVVGPGLGRIAEDALSTIVEIVGHLSSRGVPVVLDADAIHYYKRGYFNQIERCVITPNCNESRNLVVRPGHVCIYKGAQDRICRGSECVVVCGRGSDKRCGGQGDILSGMLATALSLDCEDIVGSCRSACELARSASAIAFTAKGYGLITGDILDAIPEALGLLFKSP